MFHNLTLPNFCNSPMRSHHRNSLIALALIALFLHFPLGTPGHSGGREHLTFEELGLLYSSIDVSSAVESKLGELLRHPFVEDHSEGASPANLKASALLGEYIRIAQWNIENGIEFEALAALFAGEGQLEGLLDTTKFPKGSDARESVLEQARALRSADIIVLNEADWGVARSGYRNVASDLARLLGMHIAFGIQFVELSPIDREARAARGPEARELADELRIDQERYLGLHGTAILSRFPLENVRVMPFDHQPYDWFHGEKSGPSRIEKMKRGLAKQIFLVDALRQVRRGGRMFLTADAVDQRLPGGRLTIVATHLENRSSSGGRERQLREVLATIKDIPGPVVFAGDMNTSSRDMTPTTLTRELSRRFGRAEYWAKTGLNYLLGLGMLEDAAVASLTFGRNHGDPTVRHIPIFMPNEERKFFSTLKRFRFSDGGAFDFRGEKERSTGSKRNTLANSNERDKKGFVTTFRTPRPVKFIGRYKLDWIFVKPLQLRDPSDYSGSYVMAPHFGRTLGELPQIVKDRVSDHSPLIVDLPLDDPRIPKIKERKP